MRMSRTTLLPTAILWDFIVFQVIVEKTAEGEPAAPVEETTEVTTEEDLAAA